MQTVKDWLTITKSNHLPLKVKNPEKVTDGLIPKGRKRNSIMMDMKITQRNKNPILHWIISYLEFRRLIQNSYIVLKSFDFS